MIFVTGDTHIPIDIKKLNTSNFAEQKELSKNDYMIICGDFGGVWSNSNEELYWRKWLQEKNFTTLFVDGNHENFDLLNSYEVHNWNGGNVHFINDSIIHLMRGQVYTIDDLKFFTMGGADSIDRYNRTEGKSWWKEEIPSRQEFEEGLDNLDINNWTVDYILSHTCSSEVIKKMDWMNFDKTSGGVERYFDIIEEKLKYKHWYFGHFHQDYKVDETHTLIYYQIQNILEEE